MSASHLTLLARQSNLEGIKSLLERDASVASKADDKGETAVQIASHQGNIELLSLLLSNGGNAVVNVPTPQERLTPLHLASSRGHLAICEALLEYGASVTSLDARGMNPLHHAANRGNLSIVRLLIKNKAPCNGIATKGTPKSEKVETPLALAAFMRHVDVALCLMKDGDAKPTFVRAEADRQWAENLLAEPEAEAEAEEKAAPQGEGKKKPPSIRVNSEVSPLPSPASNQASTVRSASKSYNARPDSATHRGLPSPSPLSRRTTGPVYVPPALDDVDETEASKAGGGGGGGSNDKGSSSAPWWFEVHEEGGVGGEANNDDSRADQDQDLEDQGITRWESALYRAPSSVIRPPTQGGAGADSPSKLPSVYGNEGKGMGKKKRHGKDPVLHLYPISYPGLPEGLLLDREGRFAYYLDPAQQKEAIEDAKQRKAMKEAEAEGEEPGEPLPPLKFAPVLVGVYEGGVGVVKPVSTERHCCLLEASSGGAGEGVKKCLAQSGGAASWLLSRSGVSADLSPPQNRTSSSSGSSQQSKVSLAIPLCALFGAHEVAELTRLSPEDLRSCFVDPALLEPLQRAVEEALGGEAPSAPPPSPYKTGRESGKGLRATRPGSSTMQQPKTPTSNTKRGTVPSSSPMANRKAPTNAGSSADSTDPQTPAQVLALLLIEHGLVKLLPLAAELKIVGEVQRWHHLAQAAMIWEEGSLSHLEQTRLGGLLLAINALQDKDMQRKFASMSQLVRTSIGSIVLYESGCRAKNTAARLGDRLLGIVIEDLGPAISTRYKVRDLLDDVAIWAAAGQIIRVTQAEAMKHLRADLLPPSTAGSPVLPISAYAGAPVQLAYGWWEKQLLDPEGTQSLQDSLDARTAKGVVGILVEPSNEQGSAWKVRWPDGTLCIHAVGKDGLFELCHFQLHRAAGLPLLRVHVEQLLSGGSRDVGSLPVVRSPLWSRTETDDEVPGSVGLALAEAGQTVLSVIWGSSCKPREAGSMPCYSPDALGAYPLCHAIVPGSPVTLFTAKEGLPVEDPSSGLKGILWSPLGLSEDGALGVRWRVIWKQGKGERSSSMINKGGLVDECLLGDGIDGSGDVLVIPETFHVEKQLSRVKVLNEVSSRSNPLTPNLNHLGRSSFWRGPTAQVVGAAPADDQPSLLGNAVRLNKAVVHLQPGMEDGPLACYETLDVPNQLKIKRERKKKLEEAGPVLDTAVSAVSALKPADIRSLAGYRDTKGAARMVIDAVLVMGGAKKPSRGDNDPYTESWEEAEMHLLDAENEAVKSTLKNLCAFASSSSKLDKDAALAIDTVRKDYVCHAAFNPSLAASDCKAAEVLCNWVRAVEQFERASRALAEGTIKDDVGVVVRDLGPGAWRGVLVRKLGASTSFWYDESVLLPALSQDASQLVYSKGSRGLVSTKMSPPQGVPVTDANAAPGMLVQRLFREGSAKMSSNKASMIGQLVGQIYEGAWSVRWPDASVGKYKTGLNGQFQLCFAQSNLLAGAPVMISTIQSSAELQLPPIAVTDGLMITSSSHCPTPGMIRYLNDPDTLVSIESSEARALETAGMVVTSAGERLFAGGILRLFELSHAIIPGAPLTIFTAKKGLRVQLDTGGSTDPDDAPKRAKVGTLSAPVRLVETPVKKPAPERAPSSEDSDSPAPPPASSKLLDSAKVVWEVIWDHGSKGDFVVGTEASHTCLKMVGDGGQAADETAQLTMTAKALPSPIGPRLETFVRMLDPVLLVDTGNRHRNRNLSRLISPLQSALQWHNQMLRELVRVWWTSAPFISSKEGDSSWMCRPDVELLATQPDALIVGLGGQRGKKGSYSIIDEDLTGEVTGLMNDAVSEADLDLALAVQALMRLLGSSTDYQGLHLLPANAGPSSFTPDQIVESAVVVDASKGGRSVPAPKQLVPLTLEVNACASRLRKALTAAAAGDDEAEEEEGQALFFGGEAPLTISVGCTFEPSIAPAGLSTKSQPSSKTTRPASGKFPTSPSSPTVRRITGGDDLIPEDEEAGADEGAQGSSGSSLMVTIMQQELPGRQAALSPDESLPLGPVGTLKLGCSGHLRKILLSIQRSLCALSGSLTPSNLTSGSQRSLLLVGSAPCLWIEAVELEAIAGCCPRDLPLARCRASVNRHLFDLWKACCSSNNGEVILKAGQGGSADVSARLLSVLTVVHAKAKAALAGKAAESWASAAREAAYVSDEAMLSAEEDSKDIQPFAATKTLALLRNVRLALDSLEFAQSGVVQASAYAQDAKIPSTYLYELDDEDNAMLAKGAVSQSEQDVAVYSRSAFPNMSLAVTQAAERVVGSMCERLSGADSVLVEAMAARKAAQEAFTSSEKVLKEADGASEEVLNRGKILSTKLKELADALAQRKAETEAKPTLKTQAAELKEIAAKREEARSIRGQAQALKDRIDLLTDGRAKADLITNALPARPNAPTMETQESVAGKVEDLATKWVGEYEKRQGRLDNELSKAINNLKTTVLEVAASLPKAAKPLGSAYPPPPGASATAPEKDKALEKLEDLKAIAELGVQVAKKAGVNLAEQANQKVFEAVNVAINGYGSGPIASSVASSANPLGPGSATSPLEAAREASRVAVACFFKLITAQAAFSMQLSNAAAAETRIADEAAKLTKYAAEAMSKQNEEVQKVSSDASAAPAAPPADNSAALLKDLLAEAEREANLAKKNLDEAEAAIKANEDALERLEGSINKLLSEILEAAKEAGQAMSTAASKRADAKEASQIAVSESLCSEGAIWVAHHFFPASKVPPEKPKNTAIDPSQEPQEEREEEEEEAAWEPPKGEPKDAPDADRARLAVNACSEALSVLSHLAEHIPPALRSAEAASRQIGGCRARVAASASRAAAEWTRTAALPCEALQSDLDWDEKVKSLMALVEKRVKKDEEQRLKDEEAVTEMDNEIRAHLASLEPFYANERNPDFMEEINRQVLSKSKGGKGQKMTSLLGSANQSEVEEALDIFQDDEPVGWSQVVAQMSKMSPAAALEVYGAIPTPGKTGTLNGASFDMACEAAGDHLPRALEAYFATREQVDATVDLKSEDGAVLRSLQCVFSIMEKVANRAADRAEKLNEKGPSGASSGGSSANLNATKSSASPVDPVEVTAMALELSQQASASANSLIALAAAASAAAARQTPELGSKLEGIAKGAKNASHAAKRAQAALTRTLFDAAKQLSSSGSQTSASAFGSGVLATALARLAVREPEVARQQQWTTQAVECLETKVKADMEAAIAALYPPETTVEKSGDEEAEDPEHAAAEARRLADLHHKMKLERQDKERSISAFVGSVAAEVAAAAVDLASKLDLSSYMSTNEDEITNVYKPKEEIIYAAHRLAKVPVLPDGTPVPPGDIPLDAGITLDLLATMVRTIAAVRAANSALLLAGGHPKVVEVEESIDSSLRGVTNVAALQANLLEEKARDPEPEDLLKLLSYEQVVAASMQVAEWSLDTASLVQVSKTAEDNVIKGHKDLAEASRKIKDLKLSVAGPSWSKAKNEDQEEGLPPSAGAGAGAAAAPRSEEFAKLHVFINGKRDRPASSSATSPAPPSSKMQDVETWSWELSFGFAPASEERLPAMELLDSEEEEGDEGSAMNKAIPLAERWAKASSRATRKLLEGVKSHAWEEVAPAQEVLNRPALKQLIEPFQTLVDACSRALAAATQGGAPGVRPAESSLMSLQLLGAADLSPAAQEANIAQFKRWDKETATVSTAAGFVLLGLLKAQAMALRNLPQIPLPLAPAPPPPPSTQRDS